MAVQTNLSTILGRSRAVYRKALITPKSKPRVCGKFCCISRYVGTFPNWNHTLPQRIPFYETFTRNQNLWQHRGQPHQQDCTTKRRQLELSHLSEHFIASCLCFLFNSNSYCVSRLRLLGLSRALQYFKRFMFLLSKEMPASIANTQSLKEPHWVHHSILRPPTAPSSQAQLIVPAA
jgi:hypothetical protein